MRFVLIDRLLELEPGKRALATRTFAPEEDIFLDHFPGFPVVPGVLLTEAMGQTGGWLLSATLGFTRWPLLSLVERASFRRFVRPGEELTLEATVKGRRQDDFEVRAEARVGESRAADARLLFHAFTPDVSAEDAARFQAWGRETFRRLGGEALL
jgi:3-hydroxyacyl-[acyl-carrier-protein] dehydratase